MIVRPVSIYFVLSFLAVHCVDGKKGSTGDRCPENFTSIRTSCYWFGTSYQTNWFAARERCLKMGADLVDIKDREENDYLKSYLLSVRYDKNYWLGGYDLSKKRVWTWVTTGERLVYTDWARGEPNDAKEHCIEMVRTSYLWNDVVCDAMHVHIMCETSPLPANGTIACPNATHVGNDSSHENSGITPGELVGLVVCSTLLGIGMTAGFTFLAKLIRKKNPQSSQHGFLPYRFQNDSHITEFQEGMAHDTVLPSC